MELRLPTPEQLETAYRRDLTPSFPPAELKPLSAIRRMDAAGRYRPWCLFDGEDLLGECFLWLGDPGWALLDYLCVSPSRRSGGLGARMLELLRTAEPSLTVFGEAEDPAYAPDPALAERRLGFYRRCGARFCDFRAQVFGVVYKLFYWSGGPVPDETLLRRYDAVYRTSFPAEKYGRFLQIPWTPDGPQKPLVPWDE